MSFNQPHFSRTKACCNELEWALAYSSRGVSRQALLLGEGDK